MNPALPIVPALLLSALALAGCERVAATGAFDPLRTFASRCDELPSSTVDVVTRTGSVTERYDVARDVLSAARQKGASPSHRTVGMTEVELGHVSTIEFVGLEDGRGSICMRPRVRVELSAAPITVYIAHEYRGDDCRVPLILAHEYRHVDVYRQYVEEAAPVLADALRARIGSAPHYGSDRETLRRELDMGIQAELSRFMAESERELRQRNANVDSPEEYEALGEACE